ncbi:MAG: ASKHA domain-containing protein [Steroidobacteraceae bacterium]
MDAALEHDAEGAAWRAGPGEPPARAAPRGRARRRHRAGGQPGGSACALRFPQLERAISARPGESVFHNARRGGVRIVGACGGRGTCGSCMVRVTHGDFARLGDENATPVAPSRRKWQRACQIVALGDCDIEVSGRSLAPVVRAEFADPTQVEMLSLDAAVHDLELAVPEATLADPRADFDRLNAAAGGVLHGIDIPATRRIPELLRTHGWALHARVRAGTVIDVAPAGAHTLGLAVDLGTTNAAGFLVDLRTGARLASLGIENPQSMWGADLISRINYAIKDAAAAEELRLAAVSAINVLAGDLCRAVGASRGEIVDLTVCGNTAMHHLLLGLPVRQLGRAPFVAAARATDDIRARDLGIEVAPGAYVHLAPNIGGFVGGDHVTALLATEERWHEARTALVMDIGTNTEISLIHGGRLLSASCPSGPALEGGHISCGMRAAEGAIERVSLVDGRIRVRTIGDEEPVGLCGSGVLDTLRVLREAGIIDARGRIAAGHPDVGGDERGRYAILAPGVHFTQHDVRAVQLAKAAIRVGVELLADEAGLTEQDIDRFIIAGAFGAYIDLESGIATGLFPDLPRERYEQVGNAAGLGVRRMLASRRARARAAELGRDAHYVELSSRTDFQRRFLLQIGFPATGGTRR